MTTVTDIPADLDTDTLRPLLEAQPVNVRQFIYGYHECALWASTDGEDSPPCDEISADGWSDAGGKELIADCIAFVEAEAANLQLALATRPWDHLGHDFFLSRNRHGAGFFDRGHEAFWLRLQEAARVYSTSEPYLGDDNRWYLSH